MSRSQHLARCLITTALVGAAAIYAPAHAQENTTNAPISIDEDADEVLFEADEVYRDNDGGPIVAEGDVRAYFGSRYLRADKLVYNPATDVVEAQGNVSITDEDLETVFAGSVTLSGDLRDGIAQNFSALLEDNTRIAAASAVQEQGARTRLNRAVYTACNVCDRDGDTKTPTWRIKSLRVTRDLERKVVRFHHAFFELKGVPILYTPFLQGPDPSVERQSGFLTPSVGASSRLGFNFELPYYFALSNSEDATFFPKYTAEDGILWQGEYRKHFRRGYHVLQGGIIDVPNQPEPAPGDSESIPGVRWNVFGRGYQELGDHWRASYDIERISDIDYLRQYDLERRGNLRQELNRGNTNQLRTNARLARIGRHSRLTIDSFIFQGLREQDDSSTTPYILPLIDYQHNFGKIFAGGDVSVNANLASVYRTGGTDSQRVTAAATWEKDIITPNGHRFGLIAQARADAFLYQDLDQGTEIFPEFNTDDPTDFEARFAPTIAAEWSYPLAKQVGDTRFIIEPRVQLVASPSGLNDDEIINEDSQSIEFDYVGLFDFNKATGFDAFEDGQRANIGISASAEFGDGITVESAIGRQLRVQTTDAFDFSSGLGDVRSDYVGSVNFRYRRLFGFENRLRFSGDNGVARLESLGYFNAGPVSGNVSYVRLNEENALANLVRRQELTASGRVKLTRHWSTGAAWRLDLNSDQTIRQDFSVGYEDECLTFGITYRRDRTMTTNLEPDEAFLVSFTLKSLVQ